MTHFEALPIIDISGLFSTDMGDRQAVADELGRALATPGPSVVEAVIPGLL